MLVSSFPHWQRIYDVVKVTATHCMLSTISPEFPFFHKMSIHIFLYRTSRILLKRLRADLFHNCCTLRCELREVVLPGWWWWWSLCSLLWVSRSVVLTRIINLLQPAWRLALCLTYVRLIADEIYCMENNATIHEFMQNVYQQGCPDGFTLRRYAYLAFQWYGNEIESIDDVGALGSFLPFICWILFKDIAFGAVCKRIRGINGVWNCWLSSRDTYVFILRL